MGLGFLYRGRYKDCISDNVYQFLQFFDKLYDRFTDEESLFYKPFIEIDIGKFPGHSGKVWKGRAATGLL